MDIKCSGCDLSTYSRFLLYLDSLLPSFSPNLLSMRQPLLQEEVFVRLYDYFLLQAIEELDPCHPCNLFLKIVSLKDIVLHLLDNIEVYC